MRGWTAVGMRRVAVIGVPGAGKTTLARTLAARLGAPHVELDAIFHQPGWTELPRAEFRARVAAALPAEGGWVVDGNYSKVRDLVWARADTLVWLDPPRRVALPRLVRRSLGRALRRTELWNGNRERLGELIRVHDPQRSIIGWAIRKHGDYRRDYAGAPADPALGHLRFVRLRSDADTAGWLTALPARAPTRPAHASRVTWTSTSMAPPAGPE